MIDGRTSLRSVINQSTSVIALSRPAIDPYGVRQRQLTAVLLCGSFGKIMDLLLHNHMFPQPKPVHLQAPYHRLGRMP